LSPVFVAAVELKWQIANYLLIFTLLRHRYPAANFDSLGNLASGIKSGFKINVGFGLVI